MANRAFVKVRVFDAFGQKGSVRVPGGPLAAVNRMTVRAALFALALVLLVPLAPVQAQHRSSPVLVTRVIDGDSIEIATMGRVNLLGVIAPKPGGRSTSNRLAREAQQRLAGLVTGRWVRLEFENDAGRSGRSVYLFLDDGRFVNAWMLREGLARGSAQSGLRRSRDLLAAEADARSARRGVWADARNR